MKWFNDWLDHHENALIIVIVIITMFVCLFLLTGCGGDARGGVHHTTDTEQTIGFFDHLADVGSIFTWWGLIVSGLAIVGAIIFPVARPILTLIGEGAGGLSVIGGAFLWLSEHPILVVLSLILAGLAYAYWHIAGRRMWLDYQKKPQNTEKVV